MYVNLLSRNRSCSRKDSGERTHSGERLAKKRRLGIFFSFFSEGKREERRKIPRHITYILPSIIPLVLHQWNGCKTFRFQCVKTQVGECLALGTRREREREKTHFSCPVLLFRILMVLTTASVPESRHKRKGCQPLFASPFFLFESFITLQRRSPFCSYPLHKIEQQDAAAEKESDRDK